MRPAPSDIIKCSRCGKQHTRGNMEGTMCDSCRKIPTPREWSLIKGIASGLNNKEIADKLGISINTVKTLVSRARERIGAVNNVMAAGWYQSHKHEENLMPPRRSGRKMNPEPLGVGRPPLLHNHNMIIRVGESEFVCEVPLKGGISITFQPK